MAPDQRRLTVLLSLLAVVGAIAVWRFWPDAGADQAAAGRNATAPARQGRASAGVTAPDVHLRALNDDKPRPESTGGRDLFRFKPKAPPPPPAASITPPAGNVPPGPPPPPAIPPIALRFIGLVEAPAQSQRIAILSDNRGIYQGREGDIIEGRYRILRIGVESVDMAYVDGTGRQTIRLSGS